MKQMRTLVKMLVAGSLALAMVTSLAAQTVKEGGATVVRIKGLARFTTGNNVWQPLEVGMTLKPGVLVQTAANSMVDIVLGDTATVPPPAIKRIIANLYFYQPSAEAAIAEQNVVRVMADSVLGIDKLTSTATGADVVTETQLDLKKGRLFGSVKKLSAASHYEVKIPNGIAGIRGTVYLISADGVVTVLIGSVVVSWVDPDGTVHTQEVTANQQFNLVTKELSTLPPITSEELLGLLREARFVGV